MFRLCGKMRQAQCICPAEYPVGLNDLERILGMEKDTALELYKVFRS